MTPESPAVTKVAQDIAAMQAEIDEKGQSILALQQEVSQRAQTILELQTQLAAKNVESSAAAGVKAQIAAQTAAIRTTATKVPTKGVADSSLYYDALMAASREIDKLVESL